MHRALTLSIDPQLFGRFPSLSVTGFVATNLDRAEATLTAGEIDELWRMAATAVAHHGDRARAVGDLPALQTWRNAFADCGLPVRLRRGTLEELVARVLADGRSATAVRLTALHSAIGVRHLVPIEGHDLDAMPGASISIRSARPLSDWFVPIGATPLDRPLSGDVVVYAAGHTIVSWSFEHTPSRQTCLRPGTRRGVFLGGAVTRAQGGSAAVALRELADILTRSGAQVGDAELVDARTPAADLTYGTAAAVDT